MKKIAIKIPPACDFGQLELALSGEDTYQHEDWLRAILRERDGVNEGKYRQHSTDNIKNTVNVMRDR